MIVAKKKGYLLIELKTLNGYYQVKGNGIQKTFNTWSNAVTCFTTLTQDIGE